MMDMSLDIIRLCRIDFRKIHSFENHAILYSFDDDVSLVAGSTSYSMDNRDILVLKNEDLLFTQNDANLFFCEFHLGNREIDAMLDSVVGKVCFRPEFRICINTILRFSGSCDICSRMQTNLAMEEIITGLICDGMTKTQTQMDQTMKTACSYIHANIGKDISMDDLQRETGKSARVLNARFQETFGRTPKSYMLDIRHQKACELLFFTNLPIHEICEHCGYASVSYFSADFTKRAGISPSQWRKART